MWVTGNHEILGNDEAASALPLDYLNDQFWRVNLVLPKGAVPNREITYRYLVCEADGSIVEDWGQGRVFNPAVFKLDEVLIMDAWNDPGFYENAFYTEPFRAVLLKPKLGGLTLPSPERVTHVFRVKAPLLEKTQMLRLLGNTARLGQWDTSRGVPLNRASGQDWLTVELDLNGEHFPIEYKVPGFTIRSGNDLCGGKEAATESWTTSSRRGSRRSSTTALSCCRPTRGAGPGCRYRCSACAAKPALEWASSAT